MARRRDRLDGVAAGIRADGGTALVVQADVTSQREAAGAVETAVAELGRLDTVVSNAGIMLLGPALDAPIGEWDQMVALNVQGMLYITHAALPHLVRAAADSPRQVADLVTITSTAGRVARPGSAVYNLTKFGAAAFSEALRQELISRRVRVSVIEPGTVDTELASHLRERYRGRRVRPGSWATKGDWAEAIPGPGRRGRCSGRPATRPDRAGPCPASGNATLVWVIATWAALAARRDTPGSIGSAALTAGSDACCGICSPLVRDDHHRAFRVLDNLAAHRAR